VDEVNQYTMAQNYAIETKSPNREAHRQGFVKGYNKSQETHPFSEEDMIEFETFCTKYDYENGFGKTDRKELLKLWKEQKPKIIWHESS